MQSCLHQPFTNCLYSATCRPAVKCVVEVIDNITSDTSNSSGSVDVFAFCGWDNFLVCHLLTHAHSFTLTLSPSHSRSHTQTTHLFFWWFGKTQRWVVFFIWVSIPFYSRYIFTRYPFRRKYQQFYMHTLMVYRPQPMGELRPYTVVNKCDHNF